jgi:hypothetical protein
MGWESRAGATLRPKNSTFGRPQLARLTGNDRDTDQPSAAPVTDLKRRGLRDETLVIWGGEFGRTPFLQGAIKDRKRWDRDHHPHAFTV